MSRFETWLYAELPGAPEPSPIEQSDELVDVDLGIPNQPSQKTQLQRAVIRDGQWAAS